MVCLVHSQWQSPLLSRCLDLISHIPPLLDILLHSRMGNHNVMAIHLYKLSLILPQVILHRAIQLLAIRSDNIMVICKLYVFLNWNCSQREE